MVKRYLGGVISSNQITPNSQLATGFFNTTEQLILKNKKLWELVPSWDLFRARYNSTGKLGQFSVAAQEIGANSFFFKSDGTRLYAIGETGDDVNQYELSIAWDVTTAVFSRSFFVGTQDVTPHGLFFKPDGNTMYIVGQNTRAVYAYDLS